MRNAFALSLFIALCFLKRDVFTTAIFLEYYTEGHVTGFQSRVTVPEGMDPIDTYYMPIGFLGGFFGIQTKTKDTRWILFSVWDGEKGAANLTDKGPNVHDQAFDENGTGIKTYRVHSWKTGDPQSFMVEVSWSVPEGYPFFSGYFMIKGEWNLIASIKRPMDSHFLTDFYSLLQNFGEDDSKVRKAHYSNIFYKKSTKGKVWLPVRNAVT
jgi:hypothetical protein